AGQRGPGRSLDRTGAELRQRLHAGRGEAQHAGRRSAEQHVGGELLGVGVQVDPDAERGAHTARPPSAGRTAPVIPLPPSPSRNAMAAATSSGRSNRSSGCCAAKTWASGNPYSRALSSSMAVDVEPGLTALAVMPVPRSSTASARTRPATPAL